MGYLLILLLNYLFTVLKAQYKVFINDRSILP